MINKSLPWDYDFKFVVEEISNVNDKAQVSMNEKGPLVIIVVRDQFEIMR